MQSISIDALDTLPLKIIDILERRTNDLLQNEQFSSVIYAFHRHMNDKQ